jgi:GNAT superfamily N-acetyltransferase
VRQPGREPHLGHVPYLHRLVEVQRACTVCIEQKPLRELLRPQLRQLPLASMNSTTEITIEPLSERHRPWVMDQCTEHFGGTFVVSRGLVHEPAHLPGFVAVSGKDCVGLATYRFDGYQCEIVTLHVLGQWQGTGSRLVRAVEQAAIEQGCTRVWLITTNDNVDALRFYQKRGFTLTAIYPNALEKKRKIKPTIPLLGNYGIAIRDEIELEKLLPGKAKE